MEMKSGEQNKNKLTRKDLLGTASLAGLGTALFFRAGIAAVWAKRGRRKKRPWQIFPASQHIAGVSIRLKPAEFTNCIGTRCAEWSREM